MTEMNSYTFFATCPFYLEELLKNEIEELGGSDLRIAHGGASFSGGMETAYKACLWSRIANRILFPLVSFDAEKPEDIRKAADGFEWENHFSADCTIAVDSTLSGTKICTPDYASLTVKDGVADRSRRLFGTRPDVDPVSPDIRLHLHINGRRGAVSLDLSGDGLHRRGYRIETVKAGLRENTAAAVLTRAGWSEEGPGRRFHDPMCGSGTLLIEAAMIAADIAPAINRQRFGFEKWLHHDSRLWEELREEAMRRKKEGIASFTRISGGAVPLFSGCDENPDAVNAARANLRASAVSELFTAGLISVNRRDFFTSGPPKQSGAGFGDNPPLLAVNPPYGERLNKNDNMLLFYRRMGEVFKRDYRGWNISVLTGHRELAESIALRAEKTNTLYNGGIRCTLAHFRIYDDQPEKARPVSEELSPGAEMVYNRLKKNAKKLKKRLKDSGISCYRLYDADMPEYSAAVDIYEDEVVIQEYAPPASIDPVAAAGRLREIVLAVSSFMELSEGKVHLKQRKKQRGRSQYQKNTRTGTVAGPSGRRIITEHGLKFFVDPSSYLDTGIFLDTRPVRRLIREEAAGRSFLNLFCYTGTASVYAAAGGALSTSSVDTSGTYLDWASANMRLNGFSGNEHSYVKEDCISWLSRAVGRWDLIYLDPPTFSNSKDRTDDFNLQRDHGRLIRLAAERLTGGGLLIFCNNFKKFRMDPELEKEFTIEEITGRTIDPDFERKKSIHRCWRINLRADRPADSI